MDTSKFLSKVIGLYLLIVSSAMLANMPSFSNHVHSLITNSSLMFVAGFFTLILGLLMIVSHNIWQWNWRVIITLIAWLVLIKALSILIFPEYIDQMSAILLNNLHFAYGAASLNFLLGLLLTYFGFKR